MPNRLASEKSPYLLQHADNPVEWWPWGEAAFAHARSAQKPVFLSIGYSTCHWCHVMAHESFENAAVAEVLNRDFVSIKLDREERPDVDRIYMTYVQQLAGHGGWPLSVWLTPEGKPFHGGTYFPPDDRHGRPGFVTVLEAVARHWREQREKIEAGAEEVAQALRRYAANGPARGEAAAAGAPAPLHEAAGDAFEKGFQFFYEAHDPRWGGFGGAPKFPRGATIHFLFRVAALQGVESDVGKEAIRMAAFTLQRMAEGGIHDHVGGGFHRYAVDERWHVPHFEKMLYDQAQIALNCLEARQATGVEVYAWVARGIFDYVRRDLTSPEGGFWSAEDADSERPDGGGAEGERASAPHAKAEGAFYVWRHTEVAALLGADAPFFCAHFGVKPGGNVAQDPHGEFTGVNVLMQQQPLARTAADHGLDLEAAVGKLLGCLEKLRLARVRRPRPHRDDKVLVAWNGLMISALARGAQVLREPQHLAAATRAAEFVRRELFDAGSGRLFRSWRGARSEIPGFAEDYACLIQGLLDLYEAGFEVRWLRWAEQLQGTMDALFRDETSGGYFNSPAGDPTVLVRLKEDYDGAEPAPGSIAALNLLRLDGMLGTPGARANALATIESLRTTWARAPHALPQLLAAIELALAAPRTLVIAGDPRSDAARELAAVAHERLGPRLVVLAADGAEGQDWLAGRRDYLATLRPGPAGATAYLCEDFTCQAPISDPRELRRALGGIQRGD